LTKKRGGLIAPIKQPACVEETSAQSIVEEEKPDVEDLQEFERFENTPPLQKYQKTLQL
jgi:hypothetical protein